MRKSRTRISLKAPQAAIIAQALQGFEPVLIVQTQLEVETYIWKTCDVRPRLLKLCAKRSLQSVWTEQLVLYSDRDGWRSRAFLVSHNNVSLSL